MQIGNQRIMTPQKIDEADGTSVSALLRKAAEARRRKGLAPHRIPLAKGDPRHTSMPATDRLTISPDGKTPLMKKQ